MFIHAVETPRKIMVAFNGGNSRRGNHISLLTGPNGSGKTDVLATIADVFHGAFQHPAGARVHWGTGGPIHVSEGLRPDPGRRRIRLIAQTFSPFSRFPGVELRPPPGITKVYARGHAPEEEYVCIGFNQHSTVALRTLALSIVENGVLRLSEQPKVARVAIDVLRELNFREGIDLVYSADRRLSSLLGIANDKNGIEQAFEQVLTQGQFVAGGRYIGREASGALRDELRRVGVGEVAEYVRSSIELISPYTNGFHVEKGRQLERFVFRAFRGREAMSSDYPVLQSFALLRRLGLLTLAGCTLTSYAGGAVDLTRTSSGQQQMLCSIFGLASALEDDAIVLIDEPELSLHPRWQMSFFKHLEAALEGVVACHVIIATHSPLIAQAGAAHGAEIVQMGSQGGYEHLPWHQQRADASVEELLVDVFDTPIPNSVHIANEIFGLVTRAETGTDQDRQQALGRLREYLDLYRRDGEGAAETAAMLSKAIKLVSDPRGKLADGG